MSVGWRYLAELLEHFGYGRGRGDYYDPAVDPPLPEELEADNGPYRDREPEDEP